MRDVLDQDEHQSASAGTANQAATGDTGSSA
jgi:hypothetical protein